MNIKKQIKYLIKQKQRKGCVAKCVSRFITIALHRYVTFSLIGEKCRSIYSLNPIRGPTIIFKVCKN